MAVLLSIGELEYFFKQLFQIIGLPIGEVEGEHGSQEHQVHNHHANQVVADYAVLCGVLVLG